MTQEIETYYSTLIFLLAIGPVVRDEKDPLDFVQGMRSLIDK